MSVPKISSKHTFRRIDGIIRRYADDNQGTVWDVIILTPLLTDARLPALAYHRDSVPLPLCQQTLDSGIPFARSPS